MKHSDDNEVRASGPYKVFLFIVYALAYTVFYIIPNLRPKFPPMLLPLLAIDRAMPLIPWTFIIYISAYGLVLYVILLLTNLEHFNAFSRRMFVGLFVCGTFFLFFPTAYPRPLYPHLPSGLVSICMWLVGTADTPNNCFPSMHVAMTAIAVLSLRKVSRRVIFICTLWGLAIFISTLTTKQHYFVDIMGGTTVAVAVSYLDWLFFERGVFHKLA